MFNLGGDDKEKLKENMEEIKELVNSQAAEGNISEEGLESAPQNAQPQTQNQSEPGSSEEHKHTGIAEIKEEIESAIHRGKSNQENTGDNQNISAEASEERMQSLDPQGRPPVENNSANTVENAQDNMLDSSVDESASSQPTNEFEDSSMNQTVENTGIEDSGSQSRNFDQELEGLNQENRFNDSNASNPGAPSSNGDKLFIEVDDFKNIKEKVDEMKYLSREMKDLMANLEDGIDEDRRLQGEAQDVLKDFSKRRESIQASIK